MGRQQRSRGVWVAVVAVAVVVASGCSAGTPATTSAGGGTAPPPGSAGAGTQPPATRPHRSTTTSPEMGRRATLSGRATVDGKTFDAKFIGGAVKKDGLFSACQFDLPDVEQGEYELKVMPDGEAAGCGGPGAEIVLWTYVGDARLHSTTSLPWPGNGASATFDATFDTTNPTGLAPAVVELAGEVYAADGAKLPPGQLVEAVIGDTVCAVNTTRRNSDWTGFTLNVVGPDSKPGCAAGAPLTFRVAGRPATETAPNDAGTTHRSFDLHLT